MGIVGSETRRDFLEKNKNKKKVPPNGNGSCSDGSVKELEACAAHSAIVRTLFDGTSLIEHIPRK